MITNGKPRPLGRGCLTAWGSSPRALYQAVHPAFVLPLLFLRLSFVCLCFVPRGCGFVGPPGFEPGTFRGGLFSFMVVVPWVCLGGLLVLTPVLFLVVSR